MLNLVDLFAGAGGFSEGCLHVHGHGLQILAAVDSSGPAGKTWAANRPRTPYLRIDLDPDNLGPLWLEASRVEVRRGDVDFLVGSPPCQALSAAGRRQARDARNLLFVAMLRALDRWRPQAFAMENVQGFFTVKAGAYLGHALRRLREFGYRSEWSILDAADYGVPQHRRRGFLLAVRNDVDNGAPLIPPAHVSGSGGELPDPPTVEEAIGDLPPLAAGEGVEPTRLQREAFSSYQHARRGRTETVFNHVAWSHSESMVRRIQSVGEGVAPQSVSGHVARPRSYFRNAYARLDRSAAASTITTNFHNPGSGRFSHYRDDRTLTVREAARLQSFNDDFRFVGSMSEAATQVGNAVPPMLAGRVLTSLLHAIH